MVPLLTYIFASSGMRSGTDGGGQILEVDLRWVFGRWACLEGGRACLGGRRAYLEGGRALEGKAC